MRVSYNEIYQISRKACLGCQIFEDYAEDIGRTVGLIHMKGLDGCKELESMLSEGSFKKIPPLRVKEKKLIVQKLHPIKTAIRMIDWLMAGNYQKAIILKGIEFPIIIKGLFLKTIMVKGGQFYIKDTSNNDIFKIANDYNLKGEVTYLGESNRIEVSWKQVPEPKALIEIDSQSFETSNQTWERLETYAYKTYVPETEKSRLEGAGAGIVDID